MFNKKIYCFWYFSFFSLFFLHLIKKFYSFFGNFYFLSPLPLSSLLGMGVAELVDGVVLVDDANTVGGVGVTAGASEGDECAVLGCGDRPTTAAGEVAVVDLVGGGVALVAEGVCTAHGCGGC